MPPRKLRRSPRASSACRYAEGVKFEARTLYVKCSAGNKETWVTPVAKFTPDCHNSTSVAAAAAAPQR